MNALLLAAGYGTRLYPLTESISKALLPVKNKPVIEHIIKKIEKLDDIKSVYIVTNSKFYEDINIWLKTYTQSSSVDIKVIDDNTCSEEDKLGAVGDIHFALEKAQLHDDDLLVIASDNIFDFNLNNFIGFSKKYPDAPLLGTKKIKNKEILKNYGILSINKNAVIDFQEKPENPKSNIAATGIYFFPHKCINLINKYLKKSDNLDNIGYFIKWIQQNYSIYAYEFKGNWYDIGSNDGYKLAEKKLR